MVSVIIPVYNDEKYIAYCIDSVMKQSYPEIELCLIDDGSTDASGEICDWYAMKDNRIRVFHTANAGVSSARNLGIRHATGEYILFVDSDDSIAPDTLRDGVALAEANDLDMVIIGFDYYRVAPGRKKRIEYNGNEEAFVGTRETFFRAKYDEFLERELLNAVWNKLIKREILVKNNIRFVCEFSICEDMIFSMTALRHCEKIGALKGSYYRYMLRGGPSLLSKFNPHFFEALLNYYRIAADYCTSFDQCKEHRHHLNTQFVNLTLMFIKRIYADSGWPAGVKYRRMKKVLENRALRGALMDATPNTKKKKLIRSLVRANRYQTIHLLYTIGTVPL